MQLYSLNIFLALPFFGIRMKTDPFQSCGHCWVFQICWHIECSTLTPSYFRILNNSDGIPPPPLALFGVQSIPGRCSFVSCQILIGSWKISPPATFPTIRHKVKFLCFWHGSFMYTGNHTSYLLNTKRKGDIIPYSVSERGKIKRMQTSNSFLVHLD